MYCTLGHTVFEILRYCYCNHDGFFYLTIIDFVCYYELISNVSFIVVLPHEVCFFVVTLLSVDELFLNLNDKGNIFQLGF